jgi:hypothetical protein
LAFAFPFSKDPVYGITPIQEMLRIGTGDSKTEPRIALDFSRPLDFAAIEKQLLDWHNASFGGRTTPADSVSGFKPLPCPLITTGLSAQAVEQLNSFVSPFGFMAVAGAGGGAAMSFAAGASSGSSTAPESNLKLVPGACLAVPLITGDITADVIGTVTEVAGDKVYGFGHSFLGYGPVDLPMATGKIYTVVSNLLQSFKFGSAVEMIGALTTDEASGIAGRIGAKPKMIPLTIKVDRYNDPQTRVYNCRMVNNRFYTPLIVRYTVAGAAMMIGTLPPDHVIEYKVTIAMVGAEPIAFQNISTSLQLGELTTESMGAVGLIMNNPYKRVEIDSVDIYLDIKPKTVASQIWSADLSDPTVKPGAKLDLTVILESRLAEKKKYNVALEIPAELIPGKYKLMVSGGYGYLAFLVKAAPQRFMPEDFTTLVEAINHVLSVRRDRLYFVLLLPPGGITVEKAELPDLPATKALILQDARRTLTIQPYQNWIEKSIPTGTVVFDEKLMQITVEK